MRGKARHLGTPISPWQDEDGHKALRWTGRRQLRQAGLFGLSDQLKRLSDCGDPLETMGRVASFEVFRPALEKALAYGRGQRRPTSLRSSGDVQGVDTGGTEHGERCAHGVSDSRSAASAAFIARSPGASRCPRVPRAPTPPGLPCVPVSNTCSPAKRIRWADQPKVPTRRSIVGKAEEDCSSAPSASRVPRRRSRSLTLPTISTA